MRLGLDDRGLLGHRQGGRVRLDAGLGRLLDGGWVEGFGALCRGLDGARTAANPGHLIVQRLPGLGVCLGFRADADPRLAVADLTAGAPGVGEGGVELPGLAQLVVDGRHRAQDPSPGRRIFCEDVAGLAQAVLDHRAALLQVLDPRLGGVLVALDLARREPLGHRPAVVGDGRRIVRQDPADALLGAHALDDDLGLLQPDPGLLLALNVGSHHRGHDDALQAAVAAWPVPGSRCQVSRMRSSGAMRARMRCSRRMEARAA